MYLNWLTTDHRHQFKISSKLIEQIGNNNNNQ